MPLPCPFCLHVFGADASDTVVHYCPDRRRHRVKCLSCGSTGPAVTDKSLAVQLWNKAKR
jgi:hypothetical protein